MAAQDEAFDKIMEMVGNDGTFQKRFDYIYNFGLVVFGGMSFMNIILVMNVPDYWCHVPGREHTNYTLEQWKNLTLPREIDAKGISALSKCKYYDVNLTTIQSWNYEDWNTTMYHENLTVLNCDVREYDKTWYQSTIVSQEDWVCSKDMYQSSVLALNRVGEVIGTFFFGQLGDRFGRKLFFYIAVLSILFGRIAAMFTSSNFTLFSIVAIVGSFCTVSLFQSPYVIAMEICKPDDRANVAVIQNFAWTIGMCILPFIYWIVGDWFTFFAITSLPMLIFLFIPTYMIESPRWLISRGKFAEAAFYLNRIAKINNKSVMFDDEILKTMLPNDEPDTVYGMLSLFSGYRLAKNTILLLSCWIFSSLAYFTLILYIAQSEGNPFMNFFIQSVIEIPSFFLATYLADTIGRRWTSSFSFMLSSVFCIPTILLINYVEWEFVAKCSIFIVKFWLAISYFVVSLQSTETYPTCLRQTGMAIGIIASNATGIFGPYIVYLGQKYDSRCPIVLLFVFCFLGAVAGLFLPETLHQKLPDSMSEAQTFGEDQKFWSLPKKTKEKEDNLQQYVSYTKLNQMERE